MPEHSDIYRTGHRGEEGISAQPEVSVIVPARNEEVCLARCLESLVAQEGVGFEVIVVNDASIDRTAEIARSLDRKSVV